MNEMYLTVFLWATAGLGILWLIATVVLLIWLSEVFKGWDWDRW